MVLSPYTVDWPQASNKAKATGKSNMMEAKGKKTNALEYQQEDFNYGELQ